MLLGGACYWGGGGMLLGGGGMLLGGHVIRGVLLRGTCY